jgi:hypothetical protein
LKKPWQLAKELTGHGKSQSQGIGDIQGCNNNMEKASAFNQFYIDIGPILAKAVPKTEKKLYGLYAHNRQRGDSTSGILMTLTKSLLTC